MMATHSVSIWLFMLEATELSWLKDGVAVSEVAGGVIIFTIGCGLVSFMMGSREAIIADGIWDCFCPQAVRSKKSKKDKNVVFFMIAGSPYIKVVIGCILILYYL
ncbi:MAG: hypothetical protein K2O03_10875 [Lachnospiraceae bacterium]|nr:hypothetical protein [Lachnospiraceae bacterium]